MQSANHKSNAVVDTNKEVKKGLSTQNKVLTKADAIEQKRLLNHLREIEYAPQVDFDKEFIINEEQNFNEAVEVILSKINETKGNTQRSTKEPTIKQFICCIGVQKATFYCYTNKLPKKSNGKKLAKKRKHTRDSIDDTVDALVKLGWVKKINVGLVMPFLRRQIYSRLERLEGFPLFSPKQIKVETSNLKLVDYKVIDKGKEGKSSRNIVYTDKDREADVGLLRNYNELLAESSILSADGEEFSTHHWVRRGVNYKKGTKGKPGNSYNNGRFKGGFWMSQQQGQRREITINGEAVSELDFKSMFLNNVYNLKGLPCSEDLYTFENTPRETAKLLSLICLNVREGINEAIGNKLDAINKKKQLPLLSKFQRTVMTDGFLKEFKQKHSQVCDLLFNPPVGAELMWRESLIARDIIERFVNLGIPVLTIHDSFIVAKPQENLLKQTMKDAYFEIYKFSPIIDKKY